MKRLLSLLFLLLLSIPSLAAITTHVEPSQVAQGQSFRIIYSYQGDAAGVVPDLSPLEQNFNILGTSKSSQVSIVNGNVDTSTQWIVTVIAKRSGKLAIPKVDFGQQQSNPAQIQVSKGSNSSSMASQTSNDKLFITNSVDTQSPYLHGQVIYTVKLYVASALSTAQLEPPQADNAMIKRIGKDKTYQTSYKGALYQVVEQQFAIFPQRSGKLTINPPIFKGVVRSSNLNRIYDVLNDYQQPIQLAGKSLTLDVKPQPKAFTGQHWLPAKQLSLSQQWQDLKKTNKVGSPVTRIVSIKATGLLASQLPTLEFDDSDGVSSYPEKPSSFNEIENGDIEGNKLIKVIYIPSKEGKLTFPEIKITWWDTEFNRQRVATLAAKTIYVGQAATTNSTTSNQAKPSDNNPTQAGNETQKTSKPLVTKPKANQKVPYAEPDNHQAWIIAGLFAVAWALTLLFWFFSRKKPGSEIKINKPKSFNKNTLKSACINNDAKACRDALITWGKDQWPDDKIYNLASLAEKIHAAEFKQQLAMLQAELYANKSGQWQGESLWHAWLNLKLQTKPNHKRKKALPPINP